MAISNVPPPQEVPPILLNIWQDFMGENIWLYNQVVGAGTQPVNGCPVYLQPERDVLARGLYNAYAQIRDKLHFDLLPAWHTQRIPLGSGRPYQLQGLVTEYGYVKAFGARTTALIQAGAAVTYSDADGDGVDDTATISVATTIASDEVHVYFRTADGAPSAADQRYEIFPLVKSVSGGVVTLTGSRAFFVNPRLIWQRPYADANGKTPNEATTSDPADFVTAVDVYRVYANSAAQVTLIADPFQRACCNADNLDTDQTTNGVAWLEDDRLGIFSVRADPSCWHYRPQYVYVHYQAGYDLSYDTMDGELASALSHLANTMFPYVICQVCHAANRAFMEDRGLYRNEGNERVPIYTKETPFGVAIGAQRAWQVVVERALGRGAKLTRGKAW